MVGMTNLYTYYGNNPYAEKGGQPNFRVIESFEGCVQKNVHLMTCVFPCLGNDGCQQRMMIHVLAVL